MPHLRLAAAQLNTVVGDLSGNVDRVLGALAAAEAAGADLCVTPELAITGYPPEDLLLKPGFVADNVAALEKVAAATTGQCAVVVGFVGAAPAGDGLANAAATFSSAATLSATNPGLRRRSSGGYPVMASSGVTQMSAPARSAAASAPSTRSTLPERSPTTVSSCAAARRRWGIVPDYRRCRGSRWGPREGGRRRRGPAGMRS